MIVLPNTKEGLSALLSEIRVAPELLSKAIQKMSSHRVHLTMPKFKIESDIDLWGLYAKVRFRIDTSLDPIIGCSVRQRRYLAAVLSPMRISKNISV